MSVACTPVFSKRSSIIGYVISVTSWRANAMSRMYVFSCTCWQDSSKFSKISSPDVDDDADAGPDAVLDSGAESTPSSAVVELLVLVLGQSETRPAEASLCFTTAGLRGKSPSAERSCFPRPGGSEKAETGGAPPA